MGEEEFEYFGDEEWDGYQLETDIVRFGPVNIGAWYAAKKYFAGAGVRNLTRYNESHIGKPHPGPIYLHLIGGYHFNIKEKATITPSVIYRTQGLLMHRFDPRLTVSFAKSRVIFGTYYQNKGLYGLAGADLFSHLQFTLEAGASLKKTAHRHDSFVRATFRLHFFTGNEKNKYRNR